MDFLFDRFGENDLKKTQKNKNEISVDSFKCLACLVRKAIVIHFITCTFLFLLLSTVDLDEPHRALIAAYQSTAWLAKGWEVTSFTQSWVAELE